MHTVSLVICAWMEPYEGLNAGIPVIESPNGRAAEVVWIKSAPLETDHHQGRARPMPTYVYRCDACGETFERIETMVEHETAKPPCPHCNSKKVTRVPAPFMAITGKKS